MLGLGFLAVVVIAAFSTLSMAGGEAEFVTKPGYKYASIKNNLLGSGERFYVGSTVADIRTASDSAGYGREAATPFATLDYAFGTGNCLADRGDVVIVLEGHNEGSAAVIADLDVAGVTVIGVGTGAARPRFDYDNAAATMDIGANNITLRNLTFLASAASVLIGIDIEDDVTNTTIEDCEFQAAETAGDEFVETIDLKTGNTGTVIHRSTFRTEAAAGACTHAITISAACNNVTITKNTFRGNYSTAAIGDAAAGTGYIIGDNKIKVKDGEPGIELHSGSTGFIYNNRIESTGLGPDAMIVAAGCAWFGNTGVTADGTEAEPIGRSVTEEIDGGVGAAGTGKDWFVDSVDGTDGAGGTSWTDAVDDIEEAIDLCTTALGDTIHVAPNHVETIGGAAAIDLDKAGIRLIGYGEGAARPTLTYDTTSDTVEVAATDCVIRNIIFTSNVADMAVALNVVAAGDELTVEDCEFRAELTDKEMLVAIGVATTVLGLKVRRCTFIAKAGIDCTDAVLFAGTTSRTRIEDCTFMGDWSSAAIDHSAGKATDIVIQNCGINNIAADTGLCINLEATSTGIVRRNDCHGGLTGVDPIVAPAAMRAGNTGTQVEGTEAAGKYGNRCDRGTGVLAQSTQMSLFTITGRIKLSVFVGEVDTANIQAQANATKVTYNPTAGTSQDLCAALDINGDAIGTLYGIVGDPALAMTRTGAVMANPVILDSGVIEQDCAASNSGQIQWSCYWEPFDAGATLVAAGP